MAKDQVGFIRWIDKDKQLSGQLQIANIRDLKISSDTHSFTGVINGSDINLTFNGSVWTDSFAGQTWSGTLKDKVLSLVVPNKEGKLDTIPFRAGTVDDYNNVITNLQNQLNETAAKAQEAKAQAQKEANIKDATRTLAYDFSALNVAVENQF